MSSSLSSLQLVAWRGAIAAWLALLALAVLWEWQLAPLRPGGSWLILKAVPLLLPLRGLMRGEVTTMQWALLLVLAYVAEGSVRIFDPAPVSALAWIEIGCSVAFFISAVLYLRPFKRAARLRRAGLEEQA